MNDEIVDVKVSPLAVKTNTEFGAILQHALDKGISADELAKLLDTYERMHDRQAAMEFHQAKRKFLDECPPVVKRTENSKYKVTRNGMTRASMYASLDDIEKTINKPLADNGLSYHWDDATIDDKGILRMSCTLSHVGGHSISTAVLMPAKGEAHAKESPQQLYGQANTYARRYSLVQLLGLSSTDDDNDGNPPHSDGETISEEEERELNDELIEVGADMKAFYSSFRVSKLSELTKDQLVNARERIDDKRKKAREDTSL